jgi:hypothetical protein
VDLLPWLCITVFAIGGLVAALYFLRFLRDWQLDKPDDESTILGSFRELHRSGELSAEEFRVVRTSLAEQMKRREEEESQQDV